MDLANHVLSLRELCIVLLHEMHTIRNMGVKMRCFFSIPPNGRTCLPGSALRGHSEQFHMGSGIWGDLTKGESFQDL